MGGAGCLLADGVASTLTAGISATSLRAWNFSNSTNHKNCDSTASKEFETTKVVQTNGSRGLRREPANLSRTISKRFVRVRACVRCKGFAAVKWACEHFFTFCLSTTLTSV